MIEPVLLDEAFLDDVRAADRDDGEVRLWWLGQSGFLAQWRGRHLLLDPYLSDSLTAKYANTGKPHVRMTRRIVDPARLDFIDIVACTHAHTDHLDAATVNPLVRANPELRVVIPEAIRDVAAVWLQIPASRLLGLDDGAAVTIGEFAFEGVASAHEQLEYDAAGRSRFLGYIVRFGGWTLYHGGDGLLYDVLVEKLSRAAIDVALLPINGRAPERGVPGNLHGREAAWLGHQIRARTVIPCHYEMFAFNTASPDEFADAAGELGQRVEVLRCGERWESNRLRFEAPRQFRRPQSGGAG